MSISTQNEIHRNDPGSAAEVHPVLKNRNLLVSVLSVASLIAIAFIVYAIVSFQFGYLFIATPFAIAAILSALVLTNLWKTKNWIQVLSLLFLLEFGIALIASAVPSFGAIPYAVMAIMTALILSSFLTNENLGQWMIVFGLLGAIVAIQFNLISIVPKIDDPQLSALMAIVAIVYTGLVAYAFSSGIIPSSIKTKLTLSALAVTVIPVVIISLINSSYLRNSIQEQSSQSLSVAAQQSSTAIDSFLNSAFTSIVNEASLPSIADYLLTEEELRENSIQESELAATLLSLRTKQEVFQPSYAVLDTRGNNLYDTVSTNIGDLEFNENYFTQTFGGNPYLSPVEFTPDSREAYITAISPVRDENARTIGYLRAKYNAKILQKLIEQNTGLVGKYSYPILLDEYGIRLADSFSPSSVYTAVGPLAVDIYTSLIKSRRIPSFIAASEITKNQVDFFNSIYGETPTQFFETNMQVSTGEVAYFAATNPLNIKEWHIIYLQDQESLTAAINEQNLLSTTLASLIAGAIGIIVTGVANVFTNPILNLTGTARKVTEGDLEVVSTIKTGDELETLSDTFNLMTSQLKNFIDTLESRVQERTQQLAEQNEALQFRSRQLQTVADVARSIVSSREVEDQLIAVTRLVSERFGFYHVGVFLLDEKGEYAEFKASNSPGGLKMLERRHRLRVGQVGIVGYVTSTGLPRIATDVGQDASFFNNPDLPETRSEMALPLKLEDRIIGALDVQSIESNAFTEDDVTLFTTLADQIAVGINNSQLYEETVKALEESQNLYRQYLLQQWTKQTTDYTPTNYRYTANGVEPFEEEIPEVNLVLESGRPLTKTFQSPENPENTSSVLVVPILLQGASIGAIYLEQVGEGSYSWSQQELLTIRSIADQVAQTLESTRLFEQTLRRADRERKVLEITSKIRSAADPQEMIRIALEELKANLGISKAQIVINAVENTI